MDILSFLNGFQGLGGTAQGMGGASDANPWSVAQQGSGQTQWGPDPVWQQQQLQQLQQQAEFSPVGTPPSLQRALQQDQNQQGGGQGQAPGQTGFSDLFNMTGSAPNSPGSEQGFDPNMFLRMSEGYNRGGLLGALGMLLTNYK